MVIGQQSSGISPRWMPSGEKSSPVSSGELTIAARSGGDPDGNLRLRLAITKAKEANMPGDTGEEGDSAAPASCRRPMANSRWKATALVERRRC